LSHTLRSEGRPKAITGIPNGNNELRRGSDLAATAFTGRCPVTIIPAQSDIHLLAVRELFLEYADALGVDLCFQGFQQELDELPGAYAPPDGRLLLAVEFDQAIGCVAVRKLGDGICEMKRLYVQPGHRGKGLGRRLAEAVIAEAKTIGYKKMRLDSLTSLKEAAALYRSLGFIEIPAYRYNPLPEAVFMELEL
jgi:putative acetyltransferase